MYRVGIILEGFELVWIRATPEALLICQFIRGLGLGLGMLCDANMMDSIMEAEAASFEHNMLRIA